MGRPIAEELAKKQKEISVAEFFERNKQLLGFDTPTRALLTSVKEAVDNSLDACEDAGILPDIYVEIKNVGKNEYKIIAEDNGPGIVKKQIPNIFGKLLYGSRFHAIKQSRGQQGIGISAVVMYAQLTTGQPTIIKSKIGNDYPAYEFHLMLDTRKNKPDVIKNEVILWDEKEHGTRIEAIIYGRYVRTKQSVLEYLKMTSIVNPHASLTFIEPDGTVTRFERSTKRLPRHTTEIKPHPLGIELGTLLKMAKETKAYKVSSFLESEFSRVSFEKAKKICERAGIPPDKKPKDLTIDDGKMIIDVFKKVKLMAPPTDCLSPIGEILIKRGLKRGMDVDFIVTHTRPPSVYAGHPFQVEAGIVYGGTLPKDQPITILRFANRVPLLFQQGGCIITKAIESIDWRRYGLEQRGGHGIPTGPAAVLVHVASTKVPFTSESKEAIASVEEIENEIVLAIRECARKMLLHIKKRQKLKKLKEKEEIIKKLLPLIAKKSAEILRRDVPPIDEVVAKIMNSILIKDDITYDGKKMWHKIVISATNYTPASKKFTLIVVYPRDAKLVRTEPKPIMIKDGYIEWDVKRMRSRETKKYSLIVEGLEQDDYEECEIFIKNIDPEIVNGAEPWDITSYEKRREKEDNEEIEEKEELADGLEIVGE